MTTLSIAFTLTLVILVAGVHGYRHPDSAKRSKAGWLGLCLIAVLLSGVWFAGRQGNEIVAYAFGFSLMAAIPVMALAALAAAIGRRMGRWHSRQGP